MFILIYLSVYAGIHTLFFFRIRVLFHDRAFVQWLVVLWCILISIAPVAAYLLERNGHDLPARIIGHAGFYWMGFIFLAFVGSVLMTLFDIGARSVNTLLPLIFQTRFNLPSFTGKIPVIVMLAGVCIFCVYGVIEAGKIRIERLRIETAKLPLNLSSLTIAHISDVHLGLINREKPAKVLTEKLVSLAPDLLVCTGDLIDGSSHDLLYLTNYFKHLKPPYGNYAVTGNHEVYAGLDHSLRFLETSGFVILRGESRSIAGVITIAGVDDSSESMAAQTHRAFEGIDNSRFTLFLKHRPDVPKDFVGRFDLQLSGHTHQGQMFPFHYLVRLRYPFLSGLHDLGKGSKIYISRGTGTWGPPMRIFSPPEITVIELVRKGLPENRQHHTERSIETFSKPDRSSGEKSEAEDGQSEELWP